MTRSDRLAAELDAVAVRVLPAIRRQAGLAPDVEHWDAGRDGGALFRYLELLESHVVVQAHALAEATAVPKDEEAREPAPVRRRPLRLLVRRR
jgi:hypothetical protein